MCSVALATLVGRPVATDAQKPEPLHDVHVPNRGVTLPPGWQLIVHDYCQFAVPGSWRAFADGSRAPDGSNLSIRALNILSWAAHKAQIKAAYGRVKVVHEDSDRRLWLEIGDAQTSQHIIDVASGLSACMGLLEIRATTLKAEDVRRIVDSIGPAPSH